MPRKHFSPEQIIARLWKIEVLVGQGRAVAQAVRAAGISAQGYYSWRKEYGGLRLEQAKRLKDLEKENQRLKKLSAVGPDVPHLYTIGLNISNRPNSHSDKNAQGLSFCNKCCIISG